MMRELSRLQAEILKRGIPARWHNDGLTLFYIGLGLGVAFAAGVIIGICLL
jgi:hypothetical protein